MSALTLTARQIGEALNHRGHEATLLPFEANFETFERMLKEAAPDLVFNMVEHAMGQDQLAAVAPAYLEQMGLRYTGNGPAAIVATGSLLSVKKIRRSAGRRRGRGRCLSHLSWPQRRITNAPAGVAI